jgi:hypothetical protein
MIVKILEQLAVLLESFVEPQAIVGREFVARDLESCNQVRALDVAHPISLLVPSVASDLR